MSDDRAGDFQVRIKLAIMIIDHIFTCYSLDSIYPVSLS